MQEEFIRPQDLAQGKKLTGFDGSDPSAAPRIPSVFTPVPFASITILIAIN
jgi:hypothetical protein